MSLQTQQLYTKQTNCQWHYHSQQGVPCQPMCLYRKISGQVPMVGGVRPLR
ncbi:MAG: hypothetical protein JKY13_00585 [Gammaproteobacteria bacterium]|nr:hypothetical protein [Gammaproteobacteria bacterium]